MKQDKVINIILAVANAVMVAVCVVLYLKTDRMEPRFVIQPAEIVYVPGMEEAVLYEGISAHDDHDGDITDKIVVEKIVENQTEGTVIVYYAVSDAAGNTAKFSKLFQAEYPVEVSAAGRDDRMVMELEKDLLSRTGAAGAENEAEHAAGGADAEESSGEDGGDSESQEGGDSGTQDDDAQDAGGREADGEEQADAEDDTEDDRAADADDENDRTENTGDVAPEEQVTAAPAVRSGAPELVFRTTEVKVDAGANVPWTEIISTLRDDKDDYATLYYNLQVSQYNRNKPGTYQVDVYTEDSDGNRSQTVPVTIIVR